ncbi:MAG: DegV family protein [Coriobacteriia bacterium]|nr:DegV family protein [Coriobacteriia bacterium]
MSKIGIIADSACDLYPEEYAALGVVPLPTLITFDDETFRDGVDLSAEEFYRRLVTSPTLPVTAQPSPARLLETFTQCAEDGCTEILCLILSSLLSGTYDTACMAAKDSPIPVTVIDTRTVTIAYGQIVAEASRARDEGMEMDALVAHVNATIDSSHLLAVMDTLKYLVKGGRGRKTAELAASMLKIKPVLDLNDEGELVPIKKCKGRHKAMTEMAKIVKNFTKENGHIYYTLGYTTNPALAHEFGNMLDNVEVEGTRLGVHGIGPTVGVYAGPETFGVAFYQRP